MSIDLSKCHMSPSGNILTPKGRMSYAQYLIEPQENDNGTMMYSGSLLFPPESDFSVLKKAMGVIALEKCNGDKAMAAAQVNRRFIDPMNKPGGGKPEPEEFEGWKLIRMSSKFLPDFIGANGKPISIDQIKKERLVYSGRWARFSVNPYWFVAKGNANKGVTLGLQNVQLLEHDENIGGGKPQGEGEFEAVEGVDTDQTGSGGYTDGEKADDMFDDDVPF